MMRPLILCTAIFASSLSLASPEQPTDAELNDWTLYLRSVGIPAATEACDPLFEGKVSYSQVAEQWKQKNADAISRGEAFARAGTKPEVDFDQQTASMIESFKNKMAAQPKDAALGYCMKSYLMLQRGTK